MKVQKIHENFRRFLLNENIDPADVKMYIPSRGGDKRRIILYTVPNEDQTVSTNRLFLDTVIIGAVVIEDTSKAIGEPCIPETFQISSIHVHEDYENLGFQKLLMDSAFYMMANENKGLTSDQYSGTRDDAARAWQHISNDTTGYETRKTQDGNSEFDYTNSTPDPNDDCNMPISGPATNKSFLKKDLSQIEPQYKQMQYNHIQFLMKVPRSDKSAFKTMLANKSKYEFIRRYHGL